MDRVKDDWGDHVYVRDFDGSVFVTIEREEPGAPPADVELSPEVARQLAGIIERAARAAEGDES